VAIRADVTFDWRSSPRIITVDSPSVTITVQDIHDTIRNEEDELLNTGYDKLLDAAGKTDLGGGTLTGITLILQNALLAFEARPGDEYIQCSVTGGNLAAVDSNGTAVNAISPTAFTQVVVERSVSAVITNIDSIEASINNIEGYTERSEIVARNKMVTDPETGIMTIYASSDDNVIYYQAQLYEDTAGTIPYRGTGAARRERMT